MDTGTVLEFNRTKPTVYVLGAGASFPFGFPLGGKLKDRMGELMAGGYNFYNSLPKTEGVDPFAVMRALNEVHGPTIDQSISCLEPKFRPVAHQIMVLTISRAEANYRETPKRWRDWYPEFFKLIKVVSETLPIKIVTFNYDRSLEWFLEKFTETNTPHDSRELVVERVKDIEIIRPHGSLGDLSEFPFGQLETPDQIEASGLKILLIEEAKKTSTEFERAYKAIEAAEQIVFIGFLFDPMTMENLLRGLTVKETTRNVWTTAVDLDIERRAEIRALFPQRLSIPHQEQNRTAEELIPRSVNNWTIRIGGRV